MDPSTLALIINGLNDIPMLFSAYNSVKGSLSETDLAKANAAAASARAACLADVAQVLQDLAAASKV